MPKAHSGIRLVARTKNASVAKGPISHTRFDDRQIREMQTLFRSIEGACWNSARLAVDQAEVQNENMSARTTASRSDTNSSSARKRNAAAAATKKEPIRISTT